MLLYTNKLLPFPIKKLGFLLLAIGSLLNYPQFVLAKSNNSVNSNSPRSKIKFIPSKKKPSRPPRRGTPPANEGTGSRGDCLYKANKPPLTRLVGGNNLQLTVDKYPQLWIYSPYAQKEAPKAVFSLQNGDDEVYQAPFQLPKKPGIFSISLPPTTQPLEIGKRYRWYIDINCPRTGTADDLSKPASLTGVVKRMKPSFQLQNDLATAKTALERIKIYAERGIWLNTMKELAQLRIKEPQNSHFQTIWVELLSQKQVGLEKIVREPIVGDVILNVN